MKSCKTVLTFLSTLILICSIYFFIIDILIQPIYLSLSGADVYSTDIQTNTALHIAYAFGSMSCVTLLEQNGADPECVNNSGRVPLEEAGRAVFMLPLVSVSNFASS